MVHQGSERDRFPLLANGAPGEVGLRTGLLQDHEDVRTGQESPRLQEFPQLDIKQRP